MPAKRILSAALALLLVAAIPARATSVPTLTVVEINPGSGSSSAMDNSESAALDGYLYFTATDGDSGYELWRTNGEVTELVKEIRSGADGSYPDHFTALGGYLYFRANDGTSGNELWRTDGTEAGTTRVKDINSSAGGSSDPYGFTALSGYLYFRANDGTSGNELWRTDGTEAGTTRVKDINSSAGGSSNPGGFTAFNGHLYFQAYDSTNGFELWRTDGTEAGTTRVKDINTSESGGSSPYGFTALSGYLYFQAYDSTNGFELWRTDGTEGGTTRVMDINLASSGADGSYPDHFTALNGYLYFRADDGTNGFELWRTDGTEAGTTRVEDINSGGYSSYPDDFTALGDYLYFQANDGTRTYVYRTDGTATEHVPFPVAGQSINCDCYDTSIIAVGARLYTTVYSDAIGNEFAYLDEPTYVLPETNRGGSVWTVTLVILASLTAAASIGLRVRGAKRA